jgi:hypothetical protein
MAAKVRSLDLCHSIVPEQEEKAELKRAKKNNDHNRTNIHELFSFSVQMHTFNWKRSCWHDGRFIGLRSVPRKSMKVSATRSFSQRKRAMTEVSRLVQIDPQSIR